MSGDDEALGPLRREDAASPLEPDDAVRALRIAMTGQDGKRRLTHGWVGVFVGVPVLLSLDTWQRTGQLLPWPVLLTFALLAAWSLFELAVSESSYRVMSRVWDEQEGTAEVAAGRAPDSAMATFMASPLKPFLSTFGTSNPASGDQAPSPTGDRLVIACSGGGVKSASFCLGALQRLDELGLYQRAAALVAVSGGSYAATAFSVAPRDPETGRILSVTGHELARLRRRTNYLANSPATKFELVGSIIAGLVINVLLALGVIYVTARVLAGYVEASARLLTPPGSEVAERDSTLVVFGETWQDWGLTLGLPFALVGVAIGALVYRRLVPERRRSGPEGSPDNPPTESPVPLVLCVLAAAWLLVVTAQLYLAHRVITRTMPLWPRLEPVIYLSAALVALLLVILLVVTWQRSRAKPRPPGEAPPHLTPWTGLFTRLARRLTRLPAIVIAAVIIALAMAACVALIVGFLRETINATVAQSWIPLVLVIVLVFAARMGGDVNRVSLHGFYRNRLAWAWIGSSYRNGDARSLRCDELAPDRPALLLCATVNVQDQEIIPVGRGGSPFVMSQRLTGLTQPRMRFRGETFHDGSWPADLPRGFTLAEGMAISGAAIAPLAGRDNQLFGRWRLLLAIANVRLGLWVPSPIWAAAFTLLDRQTMSTTERRAMTLMRRLHRATLTQVIYEAIGSPSLHSPYLYVTDGGHIDNLGLVEALKLMPNRIIVLDGSGDEEDRFPTMGRAIATARMDLGVEIDFDPTPMIRGVEGFPPAASVRARAVWPGGLHACDIDYVKSVLPAGLSWDLAAYRLADPTFPATTEKLEIYDEFDFEAYRNLGYLVTGAVPVDQL